MLGNTKGMPKWKWQKNPGASKDREGMVILQMGKGSVKHMEGMWGHRASCLEVRRGR